MWIVYAESEGKHETLGGDYYDERYGDVRQEEALEGKSFHLTLYAGDNNSRISIWHMDLLTNYEMC